MGVTTTFTNKPINPRGNDASPLGYNRAALYSGKALDFDGVNDSVNLDGFTMSENTGTFCFYADVDNDAYVFDINPNRFIFLHNTAQGIRVFNTNGWSDYGLIDREDTLFYTIVCDGTSQSVYVNGQQFGETKTVTALDLSAATQFKLGSNYLANGTFYNGTLSNYRIFNTALTAAQVSDLYNNPEKIVPTGVADSTLKLYLPMMEGAGTTAYDGSGNGNHGTISGATYVHGVGAPVAQSAVMDWNKGTNLLPYSEDLDNGSSAFSPRGFSQNSSTETSPIGTSDAYKFTENNTNSNPALYYPVDFSNGNSQTFKVYLKADAATSIALATTGSVNGGNINVTTEWAQYEVTQSVNAGSGPHIGGFFTITQGSGIVLYVWHPQLSYGDSVYIPTLSTAQTSDVLLPQGLTSGRDITGVNLFENVRKQGALNLDGNSWAEVHDNASLDITSAITLEAWVYADSNAAAVKGIMGKWTETAATDKSYLLYADTFNSFWMFISSTGSNADSINHTISSGLNNTWVHIVGTFDGTNLSIYVNGSQENTKVSSLSSINASDYPLDIARYDANTARIWEAPIAQPRIYNRALTAEEVLRNYNSGKSTYQ